MYFIALRTNLYIMTTVMLNSTVPLATAPYLPSHKLCVDDCPAPLVDPAVFPGQQRSCVSQDATVSPSIFLNFPRFPLPAKLTASPQQQQPNPLLPGSRVLVRPLGNVLGAGPGTPAVSVHQMLPGRPSDDDVTLDWCVVTPILLLGHFTSSPMSPSYSKHLSQPLPRIIQPHTQQYPLNTGSAPPSTPKHPTNGTDTQSGGAGQQDSFFLSCPWWAWKLSAADPGIGGH